jgi:hypothetical protein
MLSKIITIKIHRTLMFLFVSYVPLTLREEYKLWRFLDYAADKFIWTQEVKRNVRLEKTA